MQIVIDIPAETYKAISEWDEPNPKYAAEYMLYDFVKNGVVLPEKHGRLINADKVMDKMQSTFDMQELYLPIHFKELIIDEMPTVIEASGGEQDG